MEKLPLEIREIVIEEAFFDASTTIDDLRAVCDEWADIIDGFESNTKLLIRGCETIPHNCLNDILQVKFPHAVWPWQENYWKNSQSPWIPREVFRTWKLSQANFLRTRKPYILPIDYCTETGIRYIAVFGYMVCECFENDRLLNACFSTEGKNCHIINNECFSLSGKTVTHHIFDGTKFLPSTEFNLPNSHYDRHSNIVNTMKIQDSDLHVAVINMGCAYIWFYRYTITRKPNGKLDFNPHETNFHNEIHIYELQSTHRLCADTLILLASHVQALHPFSIRKFEDLEIINDPIFRENEELNQWLQNLSTGKRKIESVFATLYANYLLLYCVDNVDLTILPWTGRDNFIQQVKGTAPVRDLINIELESIIPQYRLEKMTIYPLYLNNRLTFCHFSCEEIFCI